MFRFMHTLRSLIREADDNTNAIKIRGPLLEILDTDVISQRRAFIGMKRDFEDFFTRIIDTLKDEYVGIGPEIDYDKIALIPPRECVGLLHSSADNWDLAVWKMTISPSLTWADAVLDCVIEVAIKKDGDTMKGRDPSQNPYELFLKGNDQFAISDRERPMLSTYSLSHILTSRLLNDVYQLVKQIRDQQGNV